MAGLSDESPLSFIYRRQAKIPLVAKAPARRAYDYYNPQQAGVAVPVELRVEG